MLKKSLLLVTLLALVGLIALGTGLFTLARSSIPSWVTKAPMPTGRSQFDAGVVRGKIYAIGGENSISTNLPTIEEYDQETDQWQAWITRLLDGLIAFRDELAELERTTPGPELPQNWRTCRTTLKASRDRLDRQLEWFGYVGR